MFFRISVLVLSVLPLCGNGERHYWWKGSETTLPTLHGICSDKKKHMCGGMLIRHDFVLTAAHCIDNVEDSGKHKLEVVLGAHNISKNEPQQQRIQVQKFFKHPCYKKTERLNDIMLMKLKSNAKLTKEVVDIIDLPKKNENIPALEKCSIAGWGKTDQNSAESNVLREVKLKIQFNFECRNIWRDYFSTENMICTVSDGKTAFCQGDSGSPLICGKKPQGLAAYTHPKNCLDRHYPEVYMKLSYFYPWIEQVIR